MTWIRVVAERGHALLVFGSGVGVRSGSAHVSPQHVEPVVSTKD
ncbi:hypothetical protein OG948_56025 (plasmid) [Embleya sp. NBC_00888]|nr:hypothetical protein OG948_56025 [Embleya sp. NBC_00888]